MGVEISYQCTKATVVEHLQPDFLGQPILLCDLEFENEHGIELAAVRAVVVVRERGADIETHPENVLRESSEWASEDKYDDAYEMWAEKMESGMCGFGISNTEEVRDWLS